MTQIHLIPVGEFGREVAAQVADHFDAYISPEQEAGLPSSWPKSDVQIIASWREVPWLFSLADRMARGLDRPWFPAVLDAKSLRVGPLIVPGRSGCYACFIKRQRQHSRLSPTDLELFSHYDANPDAGILGHLPSHVRIASSLIRSQVERFLDGQRPENRGIPAADPSGELVRVGMTGLNISRGRLTGVHGCPACSPADPDSSWRSLSELAEKRA